MVTSSKTGDLAQLLSRVHQARQLLPEWSHQLDHSQGNSLASCCQTSELTELGIESGSTKLIAGQVPPSTDVNDSNVY